MDKITQLEKTLGYSEDNILLWLDNTEYLYDKLQKLNDDCINTYYSSWYIMDHKNEFIANIVLYKDLVKQVYEEIKHKEHNLDINRINFDKLGHYLYLRELINDKSQLEIRLNTTKTIFKVINNE